MNSQQTDQATIIAETQTVRELTGCDNIVLNDSGWDSRVYNVENGRYYFKFPRSAKIQGRYMQEIAALRIAAEIDAVQVPRVRWQHPRNDYFGYEGVQGGLLNDILTRLDDSTKLQIGRQIGQFLRAFHARTLPGARTRSIEDEIAQFQAFYEPAIPVTQETYAANEQQTLHALVYETWPERIRSLGKVDVLSHGDLHLSNMLFDEHHGLGIIDFGDVARCDESRDLIDLEDPVIERAVLDAYGSTKHLEDKIAARKPIVQLISLTYHLKKNHMGDVERYLEMIRQYL